jgi:hypothetical protein
MRLDKKVATEAFNAWLLIRHHRNTLGHRCTFNKRKWLVPIYLDKSKEIIVMKSVQCGLSTYAHVRIMSEVIKGHMVIMAFPNDADRNEFVQTVFDPIVKRVPLYNAGAGKTDSVGIKKFFNGGIKFVSSNRETAFFSTAAQCVIVDEVDKCNLKNLEFTKDRTSATKILIDDEPLHIRLGNPTITGVGIHALYMNSDQKVYMFKCAHCNEWQPLDWFTNVITQVGYREYELLDKEWDYDSKRDIRLLCSKCKREIDRKNDVQQWVSKLNYKGVSGYHVSQLFTNQFSIRELYDDFMAALGDHTKMQVFYNSKLGLPYSGSDVKIDRQDVLNCADDYFMPQSSSASCAGVDVGNVFNVAIDELPDGVRRRAVFRGKVNDWDELKNLFLRFNVRHAVIDSRPEMHEARKFAREFKQFHIYLCEYVNVDRVSTGIYNETERFEPGDRGVPTRYVQVNRTEACDSMVASIRQGIVIYPKNILTIDNEDWIAQMEAPTRILEETNSGKRYIWTENGADDHYFHAEVYSHLACTMKRFKFNSLSITALD